jgi:hypothetical protein
MWSRKQKAGNTFYGCSSILYQLQGSSFMGSNSATQRHSLVELQIFCHFNTTAVAPLAIDMEQAT